MSTTIECGACGRACAACEHRPWTVEPYGFGPAFYAAATVGTARYAAFRDLREAGYYRGRDGFHRYLAHGVSAWRRS